MIPPRLFLYVFLVLACQLSFADSYRQNQAQNYLSYPAMQFFIDRMVQKGFDRNYLVQTFSRISRDEDILTKVATPAEGKRWHNYRPIFLTEKRIATGVDFWNIHQESLQAASTQYGIPAEYIVAIIGVETFYGRNTGKHNVLRSLTTLAMDFSKRSRFYLSELEHYLLLIEEEGQSSPNNFYGSYAGAMGLGQFIPSSYRKYAIDFNGDGHRDLWHPDDAIGSVANYFYSHGWQAGADVATPSQVNGRGFRRIVNTKAKKPKISLAQLMRYNIQPLGRINSQHVGLLELFGMNGVEYWITGDNFYVITRYNHSPKYAMAVFQLAQEIKYRRQLQQKKY